MGCVTSTSTATNELIYEEVDDRLNDDAKLHNKQPWPRMETIDPDFYTGHNFLLIGTNTSDIDKIIHRIQSQCSYLLNQNVSSSKATRYILQNLDEHLRAVFKILTLLPIDCTNSHVTQLQLENNCDNIIYDTQNNNNDAKSTDVIKSDSNEYDITQNKQFEVQLQYIPIEIVTIIMDYYKSLLFIDSWNRYRLNHLFINEDAFYSNIKGELKVSIHRYFNFFGLEINLDCLLNLNDNSNDGDDNVNVSTCLPSNYFEKFHEINSTIFFVSSMDYLNISKFNLTKELFKQIINLPFMDDDVENKENYFENNRRKNSTRKSQYNYRNVMIILTNINEFENTLEENYGLYLKCFPNYSQYAHAQGTMYGPYGPYGSYYKSHNGRGIRTYGNSDKLGECDYWKQLMYIIKQFDQIVEDEHNNHAQDEILIKRYPNIKHLSRRFVEYDMIDENDINDINSVFRHIQRSSIDPHDGRFRIAHQARFPGFSMMF